MTLLSIGLLFLASLHCFVNADSCVTAGGLDLASFFNKTHEGTLGDVRDPFAPSALHPKSLADEFTKSRK